MALFNEPNMTSGFDELLTSTANSVPAFPIMILVITYLLILVGGTSNQKRRIGSADYPFWNVLAGLTTTFLALLMTIGVGMIDGMTLGIVIAITLMDALWFFLSKQRGEI